MTSVRKSKSRAKPKSKSKTGRRKKLLPKETLPRSLRRADSSIPALVARKRSDHYSKMFKSRQKGKIIKLAPRQRRSLTPINEKRSLTPFRVVRSPSKKHRRRKSITPSPARLSKKTKSRFSFF